METLFLVISKSLFIAGESVNYIANYQTDKRSCVQTARWRDIVESESDGRRADVCAQNNTKAKNAGTQLMFGTQLMLLGPKLMLFGAQLYTQENSYFSRVYYL